MSSVRASAVGVLKSHLFCVLHPPSTRHRESQVLIASLLIAVKSKLHSKNVIA